MLCKRCGYQNTTEARYCIHCGKKLQSGKKPEKKQLLMCTAFILLIGLFAGLWIFGYFRNGDRPVFHNTEVVQVVPMEDGSVAVLYANGAVKVAGHPEFAQTVSAWEGVTQLYYDRYSVFRDNAPILAGLKEDGTVVTTDVDLSAWQNVKTLSLGYWGIIGITDDGRVLTCGDETILSGLNGLTNVESLVYADILETWGCLKKDGSVYLISEYTDRNRIYWDNVQEIRTSGHSFYVIKRDGTVGGGMEDTRSGLRGAVKVVDYNDWIFGISADGRLLTHDGGNIYTNTGDMMVGKAAAGLYGGEVDIGQFTQIRDIVPYYGLILLNKDGTAESIGAYPSWDLREWNHIKEICGDQRDITLYGVREDGSVLVSRYHGERGSQTIIDQYRGWKLQNIYSGFGGMVGLTVDGKFVGDGIYENTDFSLINN